MKLYDPHDSSSEALVKLAKLGSSVIELALKFVGWTVLAALLFYVGIVTNSSALRFISYITALASPIYVYMQFIISQDAFLQNYGTPMRWAISVLFGTILSVGSIALFFHLFDQLVRFHMASL
jgi:hypothetical protein